MNAVFKGGTFTATTAEQILKAAQARADAAEAQAEALRAENERLKDANQKYKAVLAFYGDKRNWLSPTTDSFALQYDPEPSPVEKVGASLATKVLEETT